MPAFRYCLNSSTIQPVPILEKIGIAAETGYEAIELWHADIDLYLLQGGELADIRRAIDASGLEVPTTIMLKGWLDTEGDDRAEALAECRRRLEQAAELGAKHAIAGPPHGTVDYDLAGKRYAELLAMGLTLGVAPAMEYLGFADDVDTIEDALRIMENSGRPEATIVLDPFHCYRGGGPIESIRKLRPEQIAISHFNDAPADPPRETQRDPDRVLPGEGCIDLDLYCGCLKEIGYEGFLSIELFREDLWERNPRDVARLALEKMRDVAEG